MVTWLNYAFNFNETSNHCICDGCKNDKQYLGAFCGCLLHPVINGDESTCQGFDEK